MHKLKEEENKLHKENKITLHKIKRRKIRNKGKKRKTSVCSTFYIFAKLEQFGRGEGYL